MKSIVKGNAGWLVAALFIQAIPAFADYNCATESKGQEYDLTYPDPVAGQSQVVAQCQAAPTSDNNECQNNSICDNGTPEPTVTCYTQSKGTEYNSSSEFDTLATNEAIGQCQAAPTSDNNECSSSAVCNDQPQGPYAPGTQFSCMTMSQGLTFNAQSLFQTLAQGEAIDLCQANPQTQNADCSNNVVCQPVDATPVVVETPPSVLISSINGDYNPNHSQEIYVHPGDVITLSADLFDPNDNFQAMGDSVEDFVWTANDSGSDNCDAALGNCLGSSNFQTTDYGVSYYVPYSIAETMIITVTSHNPAEVDANGNALSDEIVLRNADYVPNVVYVAPTVVITSPDQYTYPTLNPDYALAGQGNWVWINGVRYFAPVTYVDTNGDEWAPFHHGYWSWDDAQGWTWISYDPWGWMTDHYGVWRYHGVYGWVWMPFDDLHYEPHTVTWYHDGDYTGWYPYHPAFADGYVHGYNEGFRDGYEEGLQASRHIGDPEYHGGYTVVNNRDVTSRNIVEVSNTTIINKTVIVTVVNNSTTNNTYNVYPGGSRDGSRQFIESKASSPAPVTTTGSVSSSGGARITAPHPERPVPAVYQTVATHGSISRPTSIGAINQVDSAHPEKPPVTLAPTTNGKGIVPAPEAKDPTTGAVTVLPPRSIRPAQPAHGNPVTGDKPVQTAPSPGTRPTVGGYDPHKPVPAPVVAKPTPAKPAPVEHPKPLPPKPAPVHQKPAPIPLPVVTPKPPVHTHPVGPGPQPTHPAPLPTHTAPAPEPTHSHEPPTPEPTHSHEPPTPEPTHSHEPPAPQPTHSHEPPAPQPTHSHEPPAPMPTHTHDPAPAPTHSAPVHGPKPSPTPHH